MVANPILPPDEAPWSYLRLHPARVPQFLKKLNSIEAEVLNSQSAKAEILSDLQGNETQGKEPEILNPQFSNLISFVPRAFVHQSTVFSLSKGDKDPQAQSVITPIGLVFLQGETSQTKRFLQEFFPNLHLVKDRATGHTAVITAQQMSPFKLAVELAPQTISYLNQPISYFSGRTRIRILSGILRGQTGYYVRYRKDRKLVVGLAGMTIAFGGIHNETFEFLD